jgi:hypothetical protein
VGQYKQRKIDMVNSKFNRNKTRDDPTRVRDDVLNAKLRELATKKKGSYT